MMISVLFLTRSVTKSIGGMEVHQAAFLRYARELGWDVSVLSKDEKTNAGAQCWERFDPNSVHVVFFNDLSWIAYVTEMHAYFGSAVFILRSGGNDIVRAPYEGDRLALAERQRIVSSIICRDFDWVIVNSDYSYFRNRELGLSFAKMIRIRGGVDESLVALLIRSRSANRKSFDKLHNTTGRRIVVMASRLEPFKGVSQFVEQLLLRWQPNCFLLIVGDGAQYGQLLKTLESYLQHTDFWMTGALCHDETMKLISIADVFVSSSLEYEREIGNDSYIHTETMGRSIMEAVSLGIPVVATNVGGVPEIFEECPGAGLIVENHEECAQRVVDMILKQPTSAPTLLYGWNKVFSMYSQLFRKREQNVFVLDIDGTILGGADGVEEVIACLRKMTRRGRVVLNSAREDDPETLAIVKKSGVHAAVFFNGLKVMMEGRSDNGWNKAVRKYFAREQFLRDLTEDMSRLIPESDIKFAHENSLVVRKRRLLKCVRTYLLQRVCANHNFHIEETDTVIKVVHNTFNKQGAMEYLLKDWPRKMIFGAGNGVSDIGFCLRCDMALLSKRMKPYCSAVATKNVEYFDDSEIGIPVLQRLLSMADNYCDCEGIRCPAS